MSATARALVRHNREHLPAAFAQNFDADLPSNFFTSKDADEIIRPGNGAAVEPQNNVADAQTGTLRRAPSFRTCNDDGCFLTERCRMPKAARDGELLSSYPDLGPTDTTMADKLAQDEARGVRRHGKADTLSPHDHCGVDAHDLAMG